MTSDITINQQFTLQTYSSNLKGSLDFATMLMQTKMVPTHFTNAQAVVTAILYGQELGFSPMQALQSVVVIQGKPTLDTNSLKALIIQAGGRIETVKWDETICTLRFVRGDWKEEYSFSMEDAAKMGLNTKDNWKKMPKAMLYARCVSIGSRNMFADKTKGFYSTDEMRDSLKESFTDDGQKIEYRTKKIKEVVNITALDTTVKDKFIGDPWTYVLESPNSKNSGKMLCELDPDWFGQVVNNPKYWGQISEKDRPAVLAAYEEVNQTLSKEKE